MTHKGLIVVRCRDRDRRCRNGFCEPSGCRDLRTAYRRTRSDIELVRAVAVNLVDRDVRSGHGEKLVTVRPDRQEDFLTNCGGRDGRERDRVRRVGRRDRHELLEARKRGDRAGGQAVRGSRARFRLGNFRWSDGSVRDVPRRQSTRCVHGVDEPSGCRHTPCNEVGVGRYCEEASAIGIYTVDSDVRRRRGLQTEAV